MVMDPKDPNVMYVSFWQRLRQPSRMDSGGPNGGIFKTIDGGKSWRKLTKGLPEGDTGKIGLAVSRSNPKILMAIVEAKISKDLNVPGSGILFKDGICGTLTGTGGSITLTITGA